MRVTIETDDGPRVVGPQGSALAPAAEQAAATESATDGGAAPGGPAGGSATPGDAAQDGGGPTQELLDTIAAAQAAGLSAAGDMDTPSLTDAGAGPSRD